MKRARALFLEAVAGGTWFSLLAVSIVLLWNALNRSRPDEWYALFLLVAGLACFVVGALLWHHLVNPGQRDPERSWIIGACAGCLTGVLAHFATGCSFFLAVMILEKMIYGTAGSGGFGLLYTVVGCAGIVLDYFARFFWLELTASAAAGAFYALGAQSVARRIWRYTN